MSTRNTQWLSFFIAILACATLWSAHFAYTDFQDGTRVDAAAMGIHCADGTDYVSEGHMCGYGASFANSESSSASVLHGRLHSWCFPWSTRKSNHRGLLADIRHCSWGTLPQCLDNSRCRGIWGLSTNHPKWPSRHRHQVPRSRRFWKEHTGTSEWSSLQSSKVEPQRTGAVSSSAKKRVLPLLGKCRKLKIVLSLWQFRSFNYFRCFAIQMKTLCGVML